MRYFISVFLVWGLCAGFAVGQASDGVERGPVDPDGGGRDFEFRVKTDLVDIPLEKSGLEVEWVRGKFGLELQGGVIGAFWRGAFEERVYGWFLRGGPKFYLGGDGKGWALKPEVVWAKWEDPAPRGFNLIGVRYTDLGLLVNVAYVFTLGDWGVLEPMLGVGGVLTWKSTQSTNDTGPTPSAYPWNEPYLFPYDQGEKTPFGLSVLDYFHGVGGLKFGIRL